jgi:hypothetical protein
MRLLLAAERDATAAARAAADEAAATISKLEAIIAKSVNAAGTMASSSLVPAFANEPSRKVHIRSQPGAPIAMSNSATYAQAVMNSEPSLSPTVKRSTHTRDDDRDHSASTASASATAAPEPARNSSVQQHNLADKAEAAALQAAADAAAAATTEPRILRAVLLAAAATANALARSIPPDTMTAHRRGGRPPPTRPRANPRPRPRRTRRPTGMHTGTPTAAGTSTARQSSQHPAFAKSPPRAGQARPQPGARPPRFDSTRSTTRATRQIPPKVEPTARD